MISASNILNNPYIATWAEPLPALWAATEEEDEEDTQSHREGYGGRLRMRRGDVKVVRGRPGAATICGYIFPSEPLNVRLALSLSATFWCG